MARVAPVFESFNAGELSPLLEGRTDFSKYKKGLRLCENFVPLVQGPLTKRPGTYYVAETKTSTKASRLVAFEFNTTQAYIIEFGDQYVRFYKDHGQIISGTPVEVATPYLEADLPNLMFTQSNDTLYIAHPSYAPRKLTRSSHTSWTLSTISFTDGPYLSTNVTTTTFSLSATSGSVTLTASAITGINGGTGFQTTDVGRPVRIKHSNLWGWGTITARASTTSVTVSVSRTFGATTASADWRLGAWGDALGYPGAVTFYGDRLFWGGSTSYPQRLDGSNVGDYENYAPTTFAAGSTTDNTVVADSVALAFSLNSNSVNTIQWLLDDEKGLFVGTTKGEWVLSPSSLNEALTPTNVSARRSTAYGSKKIAPARAGKAALFVPRAGKKLRELAYVFEDDGFRAPDLSVQSQHLTESSGIKCIAYQSEPMSLVWAARDDGRLLVFLYEREQEALAWAQAPIAGSYEDGGAVVEDLAVIPTPDGGSEEVWLLVKRTINGATKRYVEYMTPLMWAEDTAQENAFYVDCGLTYNGTPATVMSGLSHLEGQEVSILADGAVHAKKFVSGGSVTLSSAASIVSIGLGYTAKMQTERIEAGSQNGTAQGKTKRVYQLIVRLFKSLSMKVGPDAGNVTPYVFRKPADAMGQAVPLFSGDTNTIIMPGGYGREGRIYVESSDPTPFTLLSLMPEVETVDG